MKKIEYHLNYEKYSFLGGVGGYILRSYTTDNIEEMKKYIKENITKKDRKINVWKITKEKINIK